MRAIYLERETGFDSRRELRALVGSSSCVPPARDSLLLLFESRLGLSARKNSLPIFSAKSFSWSGRRDSNPRHSAWEADALPLNYSRGNNVILPQKAAVRKMFSPEPPKSRKYSLFRAEAGFQRAQSLPPPPIPAPAPPECPGRNRGAGTGHSRRRGEYRSTPFPESRRKAANAGHPPTRGSSG